MKIFVKIKTGVKKNEVEKLDENHFKISVKESPIEGRANSAIIKTVAEYFHVAQSNIEIISGLKSKQKIIEIS
ncbi:MAG: DUF167 domain-containing protein [Candidatus Harrisonbacteria bacterium]|nr:DUF167 domain-containing protein [Candidatus Harrisonbacteria bacterium]